MTSSRTAFTYEDLLLMPEGKRYEILEGELMMVPAPGREHQAVLLDLAYLLKAHVDAQGSGKVFVAPFDVILSDTDVLQPDVIYLSAERTDRLHDNGIHGAPDLVVEVLSPGTEKRDRQVKSRIYARYGVRELWLVDPGARRIEILRPVGRGDAFELAGFCEGDRKLESTVLPDLVFMAGEVFRD